MAAQQSSNVPTPSQGDITTHEESVEFKYNDGILKGESVEIKDEDVITVTSIRLSKQRYTILSLVPSLPADQETKPRPFELQTTKAKSLPEEFLKKHQFQGLPSHLGPSSHLPILISTVSGTGLAQRFFDEILHPVLEAIGLSEPQYEVIQTKSVESIKEFAKSSLLRAANEGRSQTVVLLSGDGGVVDIINGLLEKGKRSSNYFAPTICQVPLGTGNALFHSLHKPSPLPSLYVQALRTILQGSPKPLPTFQAEFSPGSRLLTNEGQTATPLLNGKLYGAVVASYGLHATLVADSDTIEYRKHGDKRFGLVAKDLMFPEDKSLPHTYVADITLFKGGKEEKLAREEHGYVLASLVSNLEKAFTISPASKPLDGILRVVNFGPLSGDKTMDIMKAAYAEGKHVEMEGVGYEDVEGFKIRFLEKGESWKWRRVCIDGLIVGVEEGGWVEVKMVEEGAEAVSIVVDV